MASKASPTGEAVHIPAMDLRHYRITLRGTSELVMHAWSDKAKREMLDKQMGKAREKKEFKDPQADYEAAFYRLPDGRPAFPAVAFKAAIVSAARQVEGLTMAFLRGAFHVDGDLLPVDGEPRMREDMVRVGMGTADIRYRPGFPEWSVVLPVRLNARALTLEQLCHLIRQAGFSVGVGEWRPERDGSWGMFDIETVQEVRA